MANVTTQTERSLDVMTREQRKVAIASNPDVAAKLAALQAQQAAELAALLAESGIGVNLDATDTIAGVVLTIVEAAKELQLLIGESKQYSNAVIKACRGTLDAKAAEMGYADMNQDGDSVPNYLPFDKADVALAIQEFLKSNGHSLSRSKSGIYAYDKSDYKTKF